MENLFAVCFFQKIDYLLIYLLTCSPILNFLPIIFFFFTKGIIDSIVDYI